MEKTYSCFEIAHTFGYSVNDVRRWAGSHGVQFSGNSYIWSQSDYDAFAAETNYGKKKRIKFTYQSEANRYRNLYNRYSNTPTSNDPFTNKMHDYAQLGRKNKADYLEKRDSQEKGCLIVVGVILLTMLLGFCSIIL